MLQPGPKKKKKLGLALTASSKSYRTPKPEQTNSVENGFITSGQRIPTNHNQTSAKSAKPLKQATHYPTHSKHGSAQYATRLCPNLKSDLNTTASAITLLTTIQKKHSEASTANKRELSFPPWHRKDQTLGAKQQKRLRDAAIKTAKQHGHLPAIAPDDTMGSQYMPDNTAPQEIPCWHLDSLPTMLATITRSNRTQQTMPKANRHPCTPPHMVDKMQEQRRRQ